jgi:uncharacterized membrane protein YkvA (DUF1232 family)
MTHTASNWGAVPAHGSPSLGLKDATTLALTLEYGIGNHHSFFHPPLEFEMIRLFRLWRLGATDLRVLWFALRHARRPIWLWPAAIVLALYALEPLNFAIPALGVVDDLVLVPLVLHVLVKFLPLDIRLESGMRRG